MIKVVGVRFKKAGKIYYFDPADMNIQKDTYVVVETARGIEFGECVIGIKEINENDIVSPLKSVLRIATNEDIEKHFKNVRWSWPLWKTNVLFKFFRRFCICFN